MYMIQRQHSTDHHSSPGDLCWSSQHLAPGPTDCGAAPAPYINKPHRPPTRPTSRLCPLSLDLHRSTINYNSPVASDARLSRTLSLSQITVEHVLRPSTAMPPKKTEGAAPKAKSGAAHASYQDMITDAILNLKDRNGSSRQSLKKYVKANNTLNVSDNMFDSLFNKALKAGVEKGIFAQPKGPSGGTKLAKKKPEAKKAAAPKKEKDATTKKATTTKKAAAPKKAKEGAEKKEKKEKKEGAATKKAAAPKKATATAKKTKEAPAKVCL
ncbi:hypothetical protein Trisim1_005350 [Trichoderma cf. simile WF8]